MASLRSFSRSSHQSMAKCFRRHLQMVPCTAGSLRFRNHFLKPNRLELASTSSAVCFQAVPMVKNLTVSSTWTPTLAMASPFSWPVLVPCALRAPAPVNSVVRSCLNPRSGNSLQRLCQMSNSVQAPTSSTRELFVVPMLLSLHGKVCAPF